MTAVENTPGMGVRVEMKERVNSTMIYLMYGKKFCKCHNVPPPSTTIILEKGMKLSHPTFPTDSM
jgi:hypothetical protein